MTAPAQALIINVDDQEAQRYVKTRDLTQAGFKVIEAASGAEALRMIEQHAPALVLLDVQLPDIDGFEVCAFIKRKWPEVMVLQTSATFTQSEHRTRGLEVGADSYLVQPAEPLELAAAVNALLRIRRSEDALRALNTTLEQKVEDRTADLARSNAALKAEMVQRQKAEAALVQAQKMEAVGQLTGGLAHDFNNLLTAVVGNLDLIRARAADPKLVRLADNAFKAAQRGSKLTAQLLAFSRTQKLATAPVDVNGLIEGMQELLNQSLGASVTVETVLAPGLPAAMADVNQLELAILNLSINARDAMPDGGTLTITTALDTGVDNVNVTVSDTGAGMPPEVVARAFDPFFTTKAPGKGTGLGLSQVYGFVQQIGGSVEIKTAAGKGTSVILSLPRTAQRTESEQDDAHRVNAPHSGRLLIVDDDADVREIVSSVLSEIGYAVREASDGSTALALIADHKPDLLIIDFAMPGMNGADIAAAARAANPNQRILIVSGFSDSAALEGAIGNTPLLHKPFRPVELAAAVRAALET